jgi:hypothetical protein
MPTRWERPDLKLLSNRLFLFESDEAQSITSFSSPLAVEQRVDTIFPKNIDPGLSNLIFSKSEPLVPPATPMEAYDIFADNFHLGEIMLTDPLQMICTRSQDGNTIAFTNWSYYKSAGSSSIHWFDLTELQVHSIPVPKIAARWIEFSPDTRMLAISGFSVEEGRYRLILVDTVSGESYTRPITSSDNRISWSPDGNQIAVLETTRDSEALDSNQKVNIYSVINGHLVERVIIENPPRNHDQLTIQIDNWEANFYIPVQDITYCAAAQRNH